MKRRAWYSAADFDALTDAKVKEDYVARPDIGPGWFLDVEAAGGIGFMNVDTQKATIAAIRGERDTAQGRLKLFEGLEPDAARAAIKAQADMVNMLPKEKAEAAQKAAIEQIEQKWGGEVKTRDGRIEKLTARLSKELIENKAKAALLEAGCTAEGVALLLPHVMAGAKIVEVNGEFAMNIVGADGNPVLSKKPNDNSPMQFDERVALMRGEKMYAGGFPGTDQSGNNSQPGNRLNGAAGNAIVLTEAQARDPATFQRAWAESEKTGRPLVQAQQ